MASNQIRIAPEDLSSEISKLYTQYSKGVDTALQETIEEVAKESRKDVRQQASAYKWKQMYVGGWQYKVERTRTGTTAVIFNGAYPSLPHLLEFAHPVKFPHGNVHAASTTSTAKPHVGSVQVKADKEVIERLKRKLGG